MKNKIRNIIKNEGILGILNKCLLQILGLFIKKNKTIWVFGEGYSERFFNNSKHFFLSVFKNHENIHPIWFTKKRDIVKTKMIYNGVDTNMFQRDYNVKKEKNIITVCGASDIRTLLRKGVDFFVQVAFELPHYKFKIYGLEDEAYRYISKRKPENLEIFHRISYSKLIDEFSKTKVACQFSRYEAFGVAIAEAMSCECIPIGSNKGGIPTAIGDCGYILDSLDPKKAKENIEEALASTLEQRKAARQRIIENFSLDRRERNLSKLLKYYD